MITVNSSSLPTNIIKERNPLADSGIPAKLLRGPTSPIAGPTLPRQVAIAPNDETKSTPMTVSTREPKTKDAI